MSDASTETALTESMQMYLKAIHQVQTRKGAARVTDIAAIAAVNKASVSAALKVLAAKNLVNYAPYDLVTLTDEGHGIAEELDRRFRTLTRFMIDVLGLPADQAEENACSLEHDVSASLSSRLSRFIEYYEACAKPKFRWAAEAGDFCIDPDDEQPSN
ncbi:MAG: metal-dependent transcriptional regulator [Spirochaetaceae bacterium]|nr:MAG: metal-dependent transcriptional regulator [Spirochaetaceae bacterium]